MLVIGVDNYTAPFQSVTGAQRDMVERVLNCCIIQRILDLFIRKLAPVCILAGNLLPHESRTPQGPGEQNDDKPPLPWSTDRRFSCFSADFTSAEYYEPLVDIGLNEAEVIALGRVALVDRPGFDLIEYLDHGLPDELQTEYCLYSTSDVIAAIREIQQHGESAQPPRVSRLLFSPLRVI